MFQASADRIYFMTSLSSKTVGNPGRRDIAVGVTYRGNILEIEPIKKDEECFSVLTIITEAETAKGANLQLKDGNVVPLEMKSIGPNRINLTPTETIPNIDMLKFRIDDVALGAAFLEIYNYPIVESNSDT